MSTRGEAPTQTTSQGSQVIRSYADVPGIRHNTVHLNPAAGSEFQASLVEFVGTGNTLYVEDGVKLRNSRLRFLGNDSVIHLRRSPRHLRVVATVFEDSVLYLGPGASFTSEARFLPTERKHVIIGSDAMFSSRVVFRTADPHLIYSVHDRQRLNPSESIWVGDHVWLGEDVLLLKGARVGSGSILAARALVTKSMPSNSTLAGVPAKVVGSGIFWTRPSVHGFSQAQTDRSSVFPDDRFVYSHDPEVLDPDVLLSQLDSAASGAERSEWCHRLDSMTAKNRFFI
ncbi:MULTISPECIES: acyltransferase [unclassified Paenarthrobacter]|uniref:acyltransferase n=1 Tax=unclassified Paenarthrobacter TaxID=2634190 RepID=UPI003CF11BD6